MRDPFESDDKSGRHLKIAVTGPSSGGKTCFGLDAKNHGMGPVAVLSLEAGEFLYKDSQRWGGFKPLRTQSIEEMEGAIAFLESNPGKYGTLMFDTVTGLYEALVDAKAADDGSVNKNAWGLIKRKWRSLMARAVNLPLHVVFVVHELDITEEDRKTGRMQVVGQRLDAEKTFVRAPDFLIRLPLPVEGAARIGQILKVRGETSGFRVGQVVQDPHIGMFGKAVMKGASEVKVAVPEDVAQQNAATMSNEKSAAAEELRKLEVQVSTDDESAAWLIAHFTAGFDNEFHKDGAQKKYKAAIKALPAALKKTVIAAFDAATVGKVGGAA